MLFAALLAANVYVGEAPEFFDSRDNPAISWLLLDGCAVPVPKVKLKDMCYIDKVALDKCGMILELGAHCAKN